MRSIGFGLAAAALLALQPMSLAAETAEDETPATERVYGWELMSDDELVAQRTRMRAATTREERERVRAEHHAHMAVRAQERGVELIGPRPRGSGRSQKPGVGAGAGAGPGGGGRGRGGPQR